METKKINKEEIIKNLWLMSIYSKNEVFRKTAKDAIKLIDSATLDLNCMAKNLTPCKFCHHHYNPNSFEQFCLNCNYNSRYGNFKWRGFQE